MRPGIPGVAQVERDVTVVEATERHHYILPFGAYLANTVRLHDIEKIGGAVKKANLGGRIIRGDQPNQTVYFRAAAIIRGVGLQYDSRSTIPAYEPETPASYR